MARTLPGSLSRYWRHSSSGHPGLAVLVPLEEGELGDPEEVELLLVDELQLFAQGQAQLAQYRQGHAVFVCHNKGHIALLHLQAGKDGLQLFLAHEEQLGASSAQRM